MEKKEVIKKSIYFYKDIGMGKVIEENDDWKFLIQSKIIKNFRI